MNTDRIIQVMNRETGKYLIVVGILFMLMSCGKDIDIFIPRASLQANGDIDRLMTRLQEDMAGDIQTVISCPCSGGQAFPVDKDLVLVIPPDFVDVNVYPCTSGSFDLHVTVCDTKGEIVVAGIPTVSDGNLLESRIEFHLELLDGDSPVRLAPGKQIRILVNDPDPRERMELFYGDAEEGNWIQADGDPAVWDNVTNTEWFIQQNADPQTIIGSGYECFSDSMDWINIDVFFQVAQDQKTTVCLTLPEEYSNTNTAVFMVFDNYKSVLALKGDAEVKQFCEPYGATPVGYNVTFIVLAELSEGEYDFMTYSTQIHHNHLLHLEPRRTPYSEIKNYLQSL